MSKLLRWLAELLRRFTEFSREVDRGMAVMRGEVEPGTHQKHDLGHADSTSGRMANPHSKENTR